MKRSFPAVFPPGEDLTRFVPQHATWSESGRRGRIGLRQVHRHGILDEKIHSPQMVGSEKGREMGHGQNCGFGGKLYIIGPDLNGTVYFFGRESKNANFMVIVWKFS